MVYDGQENLVDVEICEELNEDMYVRDQTLNRCVLLAPALKMTVSTRGWGEHEKGSIKSQMPSTLLKQLSSFIAAVF